MKRKLSIFILLAITFGVLATNYLFAQTATDLNEGIKLEYDTTNEVWRFKWWGGAGRTYFLQHSEDLVLWNWVPVVEAGDDSVKEWGLTTNTDRFFMRLRYTDVPTTDPDNADFDGDGVSNLNEVQQGLNPFNRDSDGDGMPDGYELANGLNPLTNDSLLDFDGDLILNREDARPNNLSIGELAISITTPTQGSTLP